MEDVADQPVAVEAVEKAAGEIKSRDKQLSRASSSDSDEMHSRGSPKGGKAIAPTGEPDIIFIPHVMDKTLILSRNNKDDNGNNNNLTLPPIVSVQDIKSGVEVEYHNVPQNERELYLQTLYELPNAHNFYCPNCNSCITKVIILRDGPSLSGSNGGAISRPPLSYPPFKQQPSINVSTENRPRGTAGPDVGEMAVDERGINSGEEGGRILCSNCFSFLVPIGAWISSQLGFGKKKSEVIPAGIAGTDAAISSRSTDHTTSHAGSSSIPHGPEIAGGDRDSIALTIPLIGDETAGRKVSGGRSVEIVKSIVYGGLTEAITSLGIVTSAASAGTPTENIVAMALANLITGLIVITNNISGLKSNQPKKEQNETKEAEVDPYEEALGDRHHYLLHFITAIISFLLFGLLPPLVYGFSFRDTDDSDLKLAAVAGSSLLCIALLAIGKAYVKKPHKWQEFAKTLSYYIALGFGASGLSYLAGKEVDMLLEQLGLFKSDPTAPTFLLPNMNFAKPTTWGSI